MNETRKARKSSYDIEYAKKNIKRVPLDMQLSDYERLKVAAHDSGEKINEYIKKAIHQRMEREQQAGDGYGNFEPGDVKELCELLDFPYPE